MAGIDLARLAALTDGYSAADIAHACESAAELALLDSAAHRRHPDDRAGRPGRGRRRRSPRRSARGSTSARNVALFANEGGAYDDLAAYLKKRKLL